MGLRFIYGRAGSGKPAFSSMTLDNNLLGEYFTTQHWRYNGRFINLSKISVSWCVTQTVNERKVNLYDTKYFLKS